MRIDLDAKVRTADGHEAGHVRRVLIDAATQRVTGFVVGTGGLLGRDVIVSEDDFQEAPRSDALVLRLSAKDLEAQPTFDEGSFTTPPAGWAATMGYGYPSNAYLMPVEVEPGAAAPAPATPTLKKGDVVKDRDGDVVGVVEELRFDDRTKALTGFVVKAGAGVERLFGGGQLADIAADDILRIFDGEVRLVVDKEEITPAERATGTR